MSKRMNKKKKKIINIILNFFSVISTIVTILFCIMLYMLNMLPSKYLIIIYVFIFAFYSVLLLLTMNKKIKIIIKTICAIFFLIFDVIFCIGIKYVNDTINFVDIIDNVMLQKEKHYVMILTDSNVNSIQDLKDEDIGIYNVVSSVRAINELSKKISFNDIEFTDIAEMFDSLEEKQIKAIFINSSIKNLLEIEFADLNSRLKELYNISVEMTEREDIVKVVDVTRKPFNLYIAGGDAYGDIGHVTNTDVNMIVSVDPINRKLLLTSIPRDYYVNLPSFGENAYDKLTHAGYYGIEESVKAIENLLDIDINYYVKINFSTITKVIDAIGGVEVYSDLYFCDGAGKGCYNNGYNKLNGEKALAFARERYAFSNGDIQRVKNQQKVLTAIIDKVSSSSSIITNFSAILDSVSNSFSTNLDSKSISRLVKMQLNDMRGWSIDSQNLVGYDRYTTDTYTFPGTNLYVMEHDANSISEAKEKINLIMNK